jgi:hypothetical protein
VDGESTVEVPGVVLADNDDHYLIGPEGTELVEGEDVPDAVRAWPKATWQIDGGQDTADTEEGDDDA